MTKIPTSHEERYLARLMSDFHFFTEELWGALDLHRVAPLTWVEHDLMEWLVSGPRYRIALASRGFGKTTLTRSLCLWTALRHPLASIMVISKKRDHAADFLTGIKNSIMRCPFLATLAPVKKQADADQADNSALRFTTEAAARAMNPRGTSMLADMVPTFRAQGMENPIEGSRAHLIVFDDIETDTNTISVAMRKALYDRTKEFVSILYPQTQSSIPTASVGLGTYHHQESVYTKMAEEGYALRAYPLEVPTEEEEDSIPGLAPAISERIRTGELTRRSPTRVSSTLPHRFSDDEVIRRRATGPVYYATQFMLRVGLVGREAYPLRLRDLIVFDGFTRDKAPASIAHGTRNQHGSTEIQDIDACGFSGDSLYAPIIYDTEMVRHRSKTMWIDPAGAGRDKVGYAILSTAGGRLFVHECAGIDGGYEPKDLHRLALIAREHDVRDIYVEQAGMQGMFAKLLEPAVAHHALEPGESDEYPDGWRAKVTLEPQWTTRGQKEARIIAVLEPLFAGHRIVIPSRVIRNPLLQQQIARLTWQRDCLREIGDDLIEALAACAWKLADHLRLAPQRAAELQIIHDQADDAARDLEYWQSLDLEARKKLRENTNIFERKLNQFQI